MTDSPENQSQLPYRKESQMRFGAVFQNCLLQLQQAWEDGGYQAVADVSFNFATQIESFGQPEVVDLLLEIGKQSLQSNIEETNLAMEAFLLSAKGILLRGNGIEEPENNDSQPLETPATPVSPENQPEAEDDSSGPPIHSTLPMSQPEFREIVIDFLPLVNERIDQMRNAIERGDHKQLYADAHWLKGAGGTCGFQEFYDPSFELERAAKSRQSEHYEDMVNGLESLVQRIAIPKLEEIQ